MANGFGDVSEFWQSIPDQKIQAKTVLGMTYLWVAAGDSTLTEKWVRELPESPIKEEAIAGLVQKFNETGNVEALASAELNDLPEAELEEILTWLALNAPTKGLEIATKNKSGALSRDQIARFFSILIKQNPFAARELSPALTTRGDAWGFFHDMGHASSDLSPIRGRHRGRY
ncbi:MAG: hypothetical protein ACI9NQ_001579 [Paracoccaceae bacterium]|jgi:hypothetical protein